MFILNALGLLSGFAGALLLFCYGVPPDMNRGGLHKLRLANDEEMEHRVKRYTILNRLGMALIAVAFLLQFGVSRPTEPKVTVSIMSTRGLVLIARDSQRFSPLNRSPIVVFRPVRV